MLKIWKGHNSASRASPDIIPTPFDAEKFKVAMSTRLRAPEIEPLQQKYCGKMKKEYRTPEIEPLKKIPSQKAPSNLEPPKIIRQKGSSNLEQSNPFIVSGSMVHVDQQWPIHDLRPSIVALSLTPSTIHWSFQTRLSSGQDLDANLE